MRAMPGAETAQPVRPAMLVQIVPARIPRPLALRAARCRLTPHRAEHQVAAGPKLHQTAALLTTGFVQGSPFASDGVAAKAKLF